MFSRSKAFIILALIFAGIGTASLLGEPYTGKYQKTNGRIVKSVIRESKSYESGGGQAAFYVKVLFEFRYKSELYQSTRVPDLNRSYETEKEAQTVKAAYWPGKVVQVYFDPEWPKSATLGLDLINPGWYLILFSVLMMSLGFTFRRKQQTTKKLPVKKTKLERIPAFPFGPAKRRSERKKD